MAKRIKGITIELDGDSTPLQKALKDVDKASNNTTDELKQINRALKFDEGNTTLIAQKFDVLQDSIQNTSNRLGVLKKAQSQVEEQFSGGKIDASSYREFIREIEVTEGKLEHLKKQADNVKAKIDIKADTSALGKVESKLKGLASTAKSVGSSIGSALASGFSKAALGIGSVVGAITGLVVGTRETNQDLAMLETQLKRAGANSQGLVKQTREIEAANTSAVSEGLAKREKAIQKSQDNQLKIVEKGHEDQRKALERTLEDEFEAFEEKLDYEENALKKSLDKQYDTAKESYEKSLDELEKSLDAEVASFEKASEEKIKQIDKEYAEKLKLIDEDRYKQLKAIDDQIKGINDTAEAEEKAQEERENARRRAELLSRVATAKDSDARIAALNDLNDFDERLRLKRVKEERKELVDSLKAQKDSINESFNVQKESLKQQFDEQKKITQDSNAAEMKLLQERQRQEKKLFIETNQEKLELLKENHDAELKALEKVNNKRLDGLQDEQEERKSALDERLSYEIDKIKDAHEAELDSFRAMNQQKSNIASEPYEYFIPQLSEDIKVNLDMDDIKQARVRFAAVGQDVDQVTESMGNLIQAGYVTEDAINDISKSISGAIVQYGDTFNVEGLAESINTTTQMGEATGQLTDLLEKSGVSVEDFNAKMQEMGSVQERANYISDLLAGEGLTAMFEEYEKSYPEIIKNAEAQVKLTDSTSKLSNALTPLVANMIEMLASFIEWVNTSPEVQAAIDAITTAFQVLSDFVVSMWNDYLQPTFTAVIDFINTNLVPGFQDAFKIISDVVNSAFDFIKKVWDTILKPVIETIMNVLKTSLIPAFESAFKTISDVVKTVFEGIVKLWKKVLLPLLKLIIDFLSITLLPAWQLAFGGISSLIKTTFEGIEKLWNDMLKPIFNGIIKFITGIFQTDWDKAWSGIVESFSGIFNGVKDAIKAPVNFIIGAINTVIEGLNSLSINIPDWVPGFGGQTWGVTIPKIPMLAKGTDYFKGGYAIVGEKGPELVELPTGAKVHPNNKTQQMLGQQTPQLIVIQVPLDGRIIGEAVVDIVSGKQYSNTNIKALTSGVTV